ncbi:hypothetical protein [Desulfurispora thermophila]|nr:hypothetical protein [Desulfurispora thermophila]
MARKGRFYVQQINATGKYEPVGDNGPESVLTTEILPGLELNLAEVFS